MTRYNHAGSKIPEALLFFSEFLRDPATTGSVCPSAPALARQMIGCLDLHPADHVVELGPGTGSITEFLLNSVPRHNLVAVEKSPPMVAHLRQRFPKVKVIQGDALNLHRLVQECLGKKTRVKHVVCSLPLRVFKPEQVRQLAEQVAHVLEPGGRLVLYTYALWSRRELPNHKLAHQQTRFVWRNLPPARVDVYARTP